MSKFKLHQTVYFKEDEGSFESGNMATIVKVLKNKAYTVFSEINGEEYFARESELETKKPTTTKRASTTVEYRAIQAVRSAGFKLADKIVRAADRDQAKFEQIADLIMVGEYAKARRVYENNKDWMTLPTSALNILYPEN